jgi:hypothetical protein
MLLFLLRLRPLLGLIALYKYKAYSYCCLVPACVTAAVQLDWPNFVAVY